jgi:hypothetical protein
MVAPWSAVSRLATVMKRSIRPVGVAHREEFLVLAHRGLQHLGRQVQEVRANLAHQHDGPFDQPRDLGQQALVLDHLQPQAKALVGGVRQIASAARLGVEDDAGAL